MSAATVGLINQLARDTEAANPIISGNLKVKCQLASAIFPYTETLKDLKQCRKQPQQTVNYFKLVQQHSPAMKDKMWEMMSRPCQSQHLPTVVFRGQPRQKGLQQYSTQHNMITPPYISFRFLKKCFKNFNLFCDYLDFMCEYC